MQLAAAVRRTVLYDEDQDHQDGGEGGVLQLDRRMVPFQAGSFNEDHDLPGFVEDVHRKITGK